MDKRKIKNTMALIGLMGILLYGACGSEKKEIPKQIYIGVACYDQRDTFLEGTFWQDSLHRYHRFLRHWIMDQSDKKILLLELGVGEMTPSIIKLPFWELTAKNENVFYACLNREASHSPEHLRGRSLYLQGDLAETLAALRQARSIAATIK